MSAKDFASFGVLKYNARDFRGAISDFSRALELVPGEASTLAGRARARQAIGDSKGAVEDYDSALTLEPENAGLLEGRGSARFGAWDKAGALEDYNQAVALAPDLAQAYMGRGMVHLMMFGETAWALTDFKKAAELFCAAGDAKSCENVLRTITQLQKLRTGDLLL